MSPENGARGSARVAGLILEPAWRTKVGGYRTRSKARRRSGRRTTTGCRGADRGRCSSRRSNGSARHQAVADRRSISDRVTGQRPRHCCERAGRSWHSMLSRNRIRVSNSGFLRNFDGTSASRRSRSRTWRGCLAQTSPIFWCKTSVLPTGGLPPFVERHQVVRNPGRPDRMRPLRRPRHIGRPTRDEVLHTRRGPPTLRRVRNRAVR
jgi:hypothetical protein